MSGSDITHKKYASVAQSVEQGTENPRVGGSIPPRGTKAKDRDRAGVAQLAEQLICNQQVAGSIPVTSSNKGRFPSGQREQTVNLPTMSSVVRIHPFPPQKAGTINLVPAFCAEKGWIYEPRRFSAWFGCPPKAAAFAKLSPTGSRRRKAGSEPPPHIRTSKRRPFSVVGRGGLPNHGALARGSAVRRRRQLSRSCCHLAFEDEKREANLHPIYGRQNDVLFLWWEGVDLRTTAL